MIDLEIHGKGNCRLEHLVLDVNGTIALDGVVLPGVVGRIHELRTKLSVNLLTADTHGTQNAIDRELGMIGTRLEPGSEDTQKANFVQKLGPSSVVAIGNGVNDALMLEEAMIGVAVLGREGSAIAALRNADIIVTNILDGLDLILYPKRLVATLRR